MTTLYRLVFAVVMGTSVLAAARIPVGLVQSEKTENRALLVGVPDDLPGIDLDLNMMERLVTTPAYGFHPERLWEKEASANQILEKVEQIAHSLSAGATFLLYYSGHGDTNTISVYDRDLEITEIRDALISARKGLGALGRLVLIFDSCKSGSLLAPWDSIVQSFTAFDKRDRYWSSFMVMASSLADQLSDPSEDGSIFTLALGRAWEEVATKKGTVSDWINLTDEYTIGHRPISKIFPETLQTEPLTP